MKCLWISNNYGSIKDAIGRHAWKLIKTIRENYNDIHVNVFYGNTAEKTKKQWIYSMTMTRVINGAKKEIKKYDYDIVCIEYPFVEWNPMIIPAYFSLCRQARKRHTKISLSIHEYLRSNKIRKMVIRCMLKKSDFAFVTDSANMKEIKHLSKCYYRSIPSPLSIGIFDVESKIIDRSFIYVGLVNSSKAFYEMIEAFELFSKDTDSRLDVYTSSEINVCDSSNIVVHRNEPDDVIESAFKKATYCILPSIPDITLCNGTLKIAAQAGCTLIGKFSDSIYNDCPFGINVNDYNIEEFTKGLRKAYELREETLRENAKAGVLFGKNYSFEITADEMIKVFKRELHSCL